MRSTSQWVRLEDAVAFFEERIGRRVNTDERADVNAWVSEVRTSYDQLSTAIAQRLPASGSMGDQIAEAGGRLRAPQQQERDIQQAERQIHKLLELVKSQLIILSMRYTDEVEPRVENQGNDDDDELILDLVERGMELIHWLREQRDAESDWFVATCVRDAAHSKKLLGEG